MIFVPQYPKKMKCRFYRIFSFQCEPLLAYLMTPPVSRAFSKKYEMQQNLPRPEWWNDWITKKFYFLFVSIFHNAGCNCSSVKHLHITGWTILRFALPALTACAVSLFPGDFWYQFEDMKMDLFYLCPLNVLELLMLFS